MTSTSMGDLCNKSIPDNDEEFHKRLIEVLDDNYPENWRTWEIQDLSYTDLFGKTISPKIEAKLRFAIPTADLARAYSPEDASLSEKKYRQIKRKLLEWPLGRALLYSPHSLMEKIHSKSYEPFMCTVKLLKPKFTARNLVSSSPRKRSSTSPGSSSVAKSPRRESPSKGQTALMQRMMELLTSQTNAIQNVAAQVAALGSRREEATCTLDESFESVDSTQEEQCPSDPACSEPTPEEEFRAPSINIIPDPKTTNDVEASLTAQIAEAQRKLAELRAKDHVGSATTITAATECDFSPITNESEPKLAKADPQLAEQGRKCQRLGEDAWKNVRYAEVQKMFHATPVFGALKVNNILATSTPSWSLISQLEKTDMTLGGISYGLLLQRKAFQEACKNLDPSMQQEIQKHFLNSDCTFKKVSDNLLQYTCGRRAEIIQARRETYKSSNKVLNDILHEIPPSDTHLFCEEKLSTVVKDQRGAHKFFPKKIITSYKTGRKNSHLTKGPGKSSKDSSKFQNKKPPNRNFRAVRPEQNNNKARYSQPSSGKKVQ